MPDVSMPDRFAHAMPFGAELLEGGGVRFRLWAPSLDRVDLALEDGREHLFLPMQAAGDGWFRLDCGRAGPGSRYRYRLPDGMLVPDPASRYQAHDVHGPSTVVDPRAYRWQCADFRGRPWEETVLYELHVGTFTPEGTYRAAIDRLDHLMSLGVTAVELMPLAEFAGRRGWGYDGVLPFAPESAYGTPDDLKALVDAIHERGMGAFLDVVYNHFGPEGNYLHTYARAFFTDSHATPWGPAIDFEGKRSRTVRDFFIDNALYWLSEFRFDGLRFDAVDTIVDRGDPDILTELATAVRTRLPGRHIHLVLENGANQARYLERRGDGSPALYTAQWNDDWHHAAHVLATGEGGGYYTDFMDDPAGLLLRTLTEGFAFQGEASGWRGGRKRGEPSTHLPPTAFVIYLQNHDQTGNRALGERLVSLAPARAVKALAAVQLLSPHVPMLFMGEEWGAKEPFRFFCDFHGDLADSVRAGRKREFASFPQFSDPEVLARLPDPVDEATFAGSRPDWHALDREEHEDWLAYYTVLLKLRHGALVPRLALADGGRAGGRCWNGRCLEASWRLTDGAQLSLLANLGPEEAGGFALPPGDLLFESAEEAADALASGGDRLPGWTTLWFLTGGAAKGKAGKGAKRRR